MKAQIVKVKINPYKFHQVMEGFGASDAWRCEFVGKNWPEYKKEQIAEWLFSKELDASGSPKGIGLSIWRFNIGAGSAEQGVVSGIKNSWRRVESFIDPKGSYNWNKQKGQQWFLNQAKDYEVEKLLAFSISAPVQWTKNGKAYNGENKDGEINLKKEHFEDYANFMVDVLEHFKEQGVKFDYLSPINEPQWDWEKKSQEGTPATNVNIWELTKLLNDQIEKKRLATQIVLGEAADLRWLYKDFNKPERGNQLDYFFKKHKKELNSLSTVKNIISGHSYFTTWPLDSLVSIRKELNKSLIQHKVGYWQSEFCILEKNDETQGGWKRDLGMATALYVARVIHADITLANASSWQWWTALTNADYKDGLVYLDTGNQQDLFNLDMMQKNGDFHDSKLLWVLGNFSRFVRPGMVRVSVEKNITKKKEFIDEDIMISAYKDPKTSKVTVVAVNTSNQNQILEVPHFITKAMYVTSIDKNLKEVSRPQSRIVLEAKSVSSIIGYIK